MAKPTLRVLKLCKLFCFKTSFLLGTTGVRARSDCSSGILAYRGWGCEFKSFNFTIGCWRF
ncbi:hypothetical protein DWQ65_12495 [Treponema phagedenis]|uniref:Uncharacterized protein n=1 Tax=Treponema phagedenis TaxID=162 RepID=A0AAE6M7H5_TREPH|nr:hypothetical protein FUT79_10600 [Treponema phagedenis]QEJ98533.1 hypothetical protein FUT82_11350 [Treponema phagedenis]QEK01464.1 hypothetical protein FUT84_10075 [Treponema phagedenis]QEK04039.1 hypothetical protein FUT83_09645 [Treponema phagedenis]QEK06484.1 hypothetical protein FUT80_07005 [Treponema phagedenis]